MSKVLALTHPVLSPSQTRLLKFTAGVCFLVLSVLIALATYVSAFDVDFRSWDLAVKRLVSGVTPYQPLGLIQSFHYPLWTSFLYLPIAWFDHLTALNVWVVINLVLLVPVVWLLMREYMPDWPVWPALPFLYFLSLSLSDLSIMDAYPTVLFAGGYALMLRALRHKQPIQAGAWGCLTIIMAKPQITFLVGLSLILWLFMGTNQERRQARRWWLGAIVTGLVLLAISLIILVDWIPQLFHILQVESLTEGYDVEDGLYHIWPTAAFPDWLNYLTNLVGWPQNLIYAVFIIIFGGFGIYRLLGWRHRPEIWLALVVSLNLALTAYTRPYDFPFLLLPLFCLIGVCWQAWRARQDNSFLLYLILVALVFVLVMLNRDVRWFYFQPLLLLIGMLTLRPPTETRS